MRLSSRLLAALMLVATAFPVSAAPLDVGAREWPNLIYARRVEPKVRQGDYFGRLERFFGVPAGPPAFDLVAAPTGAVLRGERRWGSHVVVPLPAAGSGVAAQDGATLVRALHAHVAALYALAPQERRVALVDAMLADPDPLAPVAYNLLKPALVLALTDGLLADRLAGAGDGNWDWGWDWDASAVARALGPELEAWLAAGKPLDASFWPVYAKAAREALGVRRGRPELALRRMACLASDAEDREGGASTFLIAHKQRPDVLFDSWQALERFPASSGAAFYRASALGRLRQDAPWIPPADVARMQAEVARHGAIVYAVRRGPKARLYVFSAQAASAYMGVVEAFLDLPEPFDGLGPLADG